MGGYAKAMPESTRTQRLAAVMRVIGHPLSFMRKWPEAATQVGTEASDRKATCMAEQKAVAAHRAALEKSVEKLAARRDIVKAELDELETELKLLLSMLKAAGGPSAVPEVPVPAAPKVRGKGKVDKKAGSLTLRAITMSTVAKGKTTPASLAKAAGIDPLHASNVLGALARAGEIKRVSRGVYGAA